MKYNENDLDTAINAKLNETKISADLPNLARRLQTETGRARIFNAIKRMITTEGLQDIDACLVQLENQFE